MNIETIIGIDLGTSYSCCGVYKNGAVEIIPMPDGNRTLPSYVCFEPITGEIMIGHSAKNMSGIFPKNTIYDVKRLIGREYNDITIQEDMKRGAYSYDIINKNEKPIITIEFKGKREEYTPEQISAEVLRYIKKSAEEYLGHTVKKAVITCPAYFNNQQRQATKDAGTIAGLEVVRMINEPTASSLAYGLEKKILGGDKNVLVFDFGAGTLDVSVLDISNVGTDGCNVYEVKSTNGDTHLGGEDIDNILVDYCANEFNKKYKLDIKQNMKAVRKLRTACERAKITLSTTTKATIEIDSLYQGIDLVVDISRAKFELLCDNLFKKIYSPLDNAIKDAKLDKSKMDDVVLVGGTSRIPKIQEMLKNYFNGKELCKSINPDEAVAYGASVQGAVISGVKDKEIKDILLLDVVPLSLNVEERGMYSQVIIKRNSTIPIKKSEIFSTGSDGQRTVRIVIFEGERPLTKDNHELGAFELSDITPLPRGVPQIEITFDIDANGLLDVSACEKQTGKKKSIKINRNTGGLSNEDIEKMVEESKKHEKEDEEFKEKIVERNKLEDYCNSLKKNMDDMKIQGQYREQIENKIRDIENNLDRNKIKDYSTRDYNKLNEELNKIAMPILSKAYQQQSKATELDEQSEIRQPKVANKVEPIKKQQGLNIEDID